MDTLTPAKGYKYIPQFVLDEINLYLKYKDSEVPQLLDDVYSFDYTYHYSDDGSTWRRGEARYKELTDLINESGYSDEECDILRAGLTTAGREELIKRFPVLNVKVSYNLMKLAEMLEAGEYDEGRLDTILSLLEGLDTVADPNIKNLSSYLVWTPALKGISFDDLPNFKRAKLPAAKHNRLMDIVEHLSYADVEYFLQCASSLHVCHNIGRVGAPNYVMGSLLPKHPNINKVYLNDNNGYIRLYTPNGIMMVFRLK